MHSYSIEIENISKSFKTVKAVDNASFSVEKGELFGLIGPDGAGKTTLIRVLTTLLLPDTGTATLEGYDVVKDMKKIRQIIGYMPGRFSLYQDLSVEENLKFYATVFGTSIEENYDLIKDIYEHIEPFKKRPAGKLSGGMKQKLALSCALIHNPVVLFLDEPTTGVDAVSRKEFWDMLHKLKERGITILVSTPYMDEASRCDRVALMQKGIFLDIARPRQIIDDYDKALYSVKVSEPYKFIRDLLGHEEILSAFPFGDEVHFNMRKTHTSNQAGEYLKKTGYCGLEIEQIEPTIEDCFMNLMNNR